MTDLVVDASVAIKWFLPEIHSVAAERLLKPTYNLLAPELLVAEVGNVLWKRMRNQELTLPEAQAILKALASLRLNCVSHYVLIAPALEIANHTDRTVYDSLYLALAIRENCRVVTADRRFAQAIQKTPLANHLLWVEDV